MNRNASDPEIGRILAMPGIREVIAVPRTIPRDVREGIAAILADELVNGNSWETRDQGQTIRRLGPLFLMLNAVRGTQTWAKLKSLSSRNRMIALLCLSSTLEALLDTHEEISCGRFPREGIEAVVAFEALIAETLTSWGRKPDLPPGSGRTSPEYYSNIENVRLIHGIVRQMLVPRLEASLHDIYDSIDAIELTSLLSAGRDWDNALTNLQHGDIRDIKRYSDIVRRNRELTAMIDEIGRASTGVSSEGTRLLHHGRSEIHSIITSSDLPYMLPSELLKLQDGLLKYLFFARWAEGKLLTYQLKEPGQAVTENRKRKGPVVALVDTSGSMDGAPGILAKAIVLAAARNFLRDGRAMNVALFSSIGQVIEIDLTNGQFSQFMEFLRSSFGGGTDFDSALRSGLNVLKNARYTYADLLFVTDGMSRLTDQGLIDEWNNLKATRDNQIFTVIVGNDQAGGLEEISDRVYIFGQKSVNKSI